MKKVTEKYLSALTFFLVYCGLVFLTSLLLFIFKDYLLVPYDQINLYPSVRTLWGIASSILLSWLLAHTIEQFFIFFLRQAAQAYNLLYAPQYLSLANYVLSYNQCIILLVQYCPLILLYGLFIIFITHIIINILIGTIFDKKITACAYDTYMVLSTAVHSILYVISWLYNHALFQLLSFLLTHNMYTAYCILSRIFTKDLPRNTHYFHNNPNSIPSDIFRNFGSMLHIKILLQKYSDDTEALEETCKDIEESLSATSNAYTFLKVMMYLATIGSLKTDNIHDLTRALLKHYKNIRYLLTNISEEHISEELIQNIINNNRNDVASELFQVFLTSTSCTYTRSSQNPLSEQELSDFIDVYHMLHSYDTYLQRCFRAPFIQKTSDGRMYDTIENLQHAPTSTKNILHILQRYQKLFYNPLFDHSLLTPKNVNSILKKQKDTTPTEHAELSYTLALLGRSGLLNTQTLHDVLEHDIFIPNRDDVRNVLPRFIYDEVWNNIKNAAIDATQRGLTLQAKKDHIAQAILRMFVQPLNAHGRNGGGINYGAQSTHQVKIHASASDGAILLKERYPSCNVEATTQEILSYINVTMDNQSLGEEDRLIYEIAQRSIHYTRSYTELDPKSQITARKFLALGWVGLCDDNPSYHPESYSKDDAIYSFLKVLRDIMRCYNYNDMFIDQGGRDIPSCPGGAFNKIHEALSCHIIGIQQNMGTIADLTSVFQHTVQKLWAECPALKEQETLTSDDYETHLKKDVHKKLTEDFASFSDNGKSLTACLSELEKYIEDMGPSARALSSVMGP